MTGVALPPPEPPARDVDEVLELLRVARVELGHAKARLERVKAWQNDPMANMTDRMKLGVMRQTREKAVELWAVQVTALEGRVRAMGLRP